MDEVVAYGRYWAKDWIWATAAEIHATIAATLDPFNPLLWARDGPYSTAETQATVAWFLTLCQRGNSKDVVLNRKLFSLSNSQGLYNHIHWESQGNRLLLRGMQERVMLERGFAKLKNSCGYRSWRGISQKRLGKNTRFYNPIPTWVSDKNSQWKFCTIRTQIICWRK